MYVHKDTSVTTPAVDHMYEAKPQLTKLKFHGHLYIMMTLISHITVYGLD